MWRRRRSDEDFGSEIRVHIELEVDRLIGEGLSPEDARLLLFVSSATSPRLRNASMNPGECSGSTSQVRICATPGEC